LFVKGVGHHSVKPEIRAAVAEAVQRLQAHTATLQSLRPRRPASPSDASDKSDGSDPPPPPPPPPPPIRETPAPYLTATHRAALDWLATHPTHLDALLPLLKQLGHTADPGPPK
jgi:hypothetical protein